MPTTRIVFDEGMPASYYRNAVDAIHPVSYIMGEILDSFFVAEMTVEQYRARMVEYLDALGDKVDVWEIANEINGSWVGETSQTIAKISAAYDETKARRKQTALTLHYAPLCEQPAHEFFTWAANIPARMKAGLDYVFISFYEDDCPDQPNWQQVFNRLGEMFPSSKIGFGENGSRHAERKQPYLDLYYGANTESARIQHPRYVRGHFWWYFKQDMVPYTKPLWNVLHEKMMALPAPR